MGKSISAKQKKRGRGRPSTGVTPMIGLRAAPQLRADIQKWANREPDKPKLSEAIRRLVELGLASARPASRHNPKAGAKARQLAAETIAALTDPSAPPEEQARRKRRLTKGPPEFREMRADVPLAKK